MSARRHRVWWGRGRRRGRLWCDSPGRVDAVCAVVGAVWSCFVLLVLVVEVLAAVGLVSHGGTP